MFISLRCCCLICWLFVICSFIYLFIYDPPPPPISKKNQQQQIICVLFYVCSQQIDIRQQKQLTHRTMNNKFDNGSYNISFLFLFCCCCCCCFYPLHCLQAFIILTSYLFVLLILYLSITPLNECTLLN